MKLKTIVSMVAMTALFIGCGGGDSTLSGVDTGETTPVSDPISTKATALEGVWDQGCVNDGADGSNSMTITFRGNTQEIVSDVWGNSSNCQGQKSSHIRITGIIKIGATITADDGKPATQIDSTTQKYYATLTDDAYIISQQGYLDATCDPVPTLVLNQEVDVSGCPDSFAYGKDVTLRGLFRIEGNKLYSEPDDFNDDIAHPTVGYPSAIDSTTYLTKIQN